MVHPTKINGRATEQPNWNRKRNDRGLTTLEWLLIVAAVAGLAALAVVLVQNVVDETAEQISGSSARLTAALVAAQEITDDCKNTTHADGCNAAADNAVTDAKAKCDRLRITYGDAFTDSSPNKEAVWFILAVADNATTPEKYDGSAIVISQWTCRIVDTLTARPSGRT